MRYPIGAKVRIKLRGPQRRMAARFFMGQETADWWIINFPHDNDDIGTIDSYPIITRPSYVREGGLWHSHCEPPEYAVKYRGWWLIMLYAHEVELVASSNWRGIVSGFLAGIAERIRFDAKGRDHWLNPPEAPSEDKAQRDSAAKEFNDRRP